MAGTMLVKVLVTYPQKLVFPSLQLSIWSKIPLNIVILNPYHEAAHVNQTSEIIKFYVIKLKKVLRYVKCHLQNFKLLKISYTQY